MYVHFCKCIYMYVHGMCTYIVQTCMYMFIHLCTRFQSYKRVRTMYKSGCQVFVYLMLNVQKAVYIL